MSDNANCVIGRLRGARELAGLSQQELAQLAACSLSMVRLLESGYQPHSSDVLDRITRALAARMADPAAGNQDPETAGGKSPEVRRDSAGARQAS